MTPNPYWEELKRYRPLQADLEASQVIDTLATYPRLTKPKLKLSSFADIAKCELPSVERVPITVIENRPIPFFTHPELQSLSRRQKLTEVAEALAVLLLRAAALEARGLKRTVDTDTATDDESDEHWADTLARWVDDAKLISEGRSPLGASEFFFSFSYWDRRTVQWRKNHPSSVCWGFKALYSWPYHCHGAAVRDATLGAALWLAAFGTTILYFAFLLGAP